MNAASVVTTSAVTKKAAEPQVRIAVKPVASAAEAAGPRVASQAARGARQEALTKAARDARVRPAAARTSPGLGFPKRRIAARQPVSPLEEVVTAADVSGLTEEERIESSKYDSRDRRRRVFEEERFLFPETYEVDRVRLLVKDPEWLFAHWDVSPTSFARLRKDLGERALALSRLTLKVEDPANGVLSVVLLPEGIRSWYVRTLAGHRTYRAELGLTTPSGEFRALAASNVVVTPRVGRAEQQATRRVSIHRVDEARKEPVREEAAKPAAPPAGKRARPKATPVSYVDGSLESSQPETPPHSEPQQGGASDVFRPGGAVGDDRKPGGKPGGASDVFRR